MFWNDDIALEFLYSVIHVLISVGFRLIDIIYPVLVQYLILY